MKKLFINQPIMGRSIAAINKTHDKLLDIAKIMFGEDLEVIVGPVAYDMEKLVPGALTDYKNVDICSYGCQFLAMAQADYFIGVDIRDAWDEDLEVVGRHASKLEKYVIIDGTHLMGDYKEYCDYLKKREREKFDIPEIQVTPL